MKFKFMRIISAVLTAAVLFCAVGCEFGTYVKTSQDPETSVTGFFDCVKSKNFADCDRYLADNASFEIKNQTGYALADVMLDARLSQLSYEMVSSPAVNGSDASCIVKVTAPDVFGIKAAMAEAYNKARNSYVKENNLTEFPLDDKEVVNKVATDAFNSVSDQAESESVEVVIKLNFQDGMWKIIVTDELCTAILGEVTANEE